MDTTTVLPYDVEECIKKCIAAKREEYNLSTSFPNPVPREDVLNLLDKFCTVIYYPLNHEGNNGFHVTDIPVIDDNKNHFVFINTAQTIEKQIFTAAHELGHVWNVDDYVLSQIDSIEDSSPNRELIINRFAAVLLMPDEHFRSAYQDELKKLVEPDRSITLLNVLKLVVLLMGQFFAPMKAVVLRFVELGYMKYESASILLGKGSLQPVVIEQVKKKLVSDFGYLKFQKPTEKKWIEGLSELLDTAEQNQLVSQEKIIRMREAFDLDASAIFAADATDMNQVIPLSTQEV